MKTKEVLIARIYITESSHMLNTIVNYLQKDAKIKGFSVFRAISGFGETGSHNTSLVDLSLDLPLVIEFFDQKEKIEMAIEHLNESMKQAHIVFWSAKAVSNQVQ